MVWLVLVTLIPKGAGVEAELLRKARVSQEWPWMTWETPWVSRWDGASVEASPRMSQGGEASDGASPCESRGQPKGVPGWWS